MPRTNTYPNQRMIQIHRERIISDFLGIKNENWQAAARDLGPHALLLYLYLASNADEYRLALSPAHIREAVGMPRSTYHDQFHKLVDKGYLVLQQNNTYDFYEVPQKQKKSEEEMSVETSDGLNFQNDTIAENLLPKNGFYVSPKNIEINKNNT